MPNRILKESICTSDTIDQLTTEEENFFYRLLVNCDDFGRMDGRIKIIVAKCYPLKDKSITEDIEKRLVKLINVGLVRSYVSNELPYLQIATWDKHQQVRAKKSKYPEPTAESYNGYHVISDDSICHRNPIQSNPIRIQSESNPIPENISSHSLSDIADTDPLFEEFWEAYPKQVYKTKALKAWKARRKEKVDPHDMITASKNYALDRRGKDQQYTQHPSTFLGPARPYKDYLKPIQNLPQNRPKSFDAIDQWDKMTEGLIE